MLFGDAKKAIKRATSPGVVIRPVAAPSELINCRLKSSCETPCLLGDVSDQSVRVGP
jgi:hypothetical protein